LVWVSGGEMTNDPASTDSGAASECQMTKEIRMTNPHFDFVFPPRSEFCNSL